MDENPGRPLPLPKGQVHVWLARPENLALDRLSSLEKILSGPELAKCRRYVKEERRRVCVIARALARTVLSKYAETRPGDWEFGENRHGKPEIAGPRNIGELRFNLSHAEGLVACAVARRADLGVDVENLDRKVDLKAVHRFFAPAEVQALENTPGPEKKRRFLELWTLKEAFVKARGQGLSLGLDKFWFTLGKGSPPAVSFAFGARDSPDHWRFFLLSPTPGHVLAVAVGKGGASLGEPKLMEWLPDC